MAGNQGIQTPIGTVVLGVKLGDCANGARYMRIHYTADPSKNGEYIQREKHKTPLREWNREMEMDENVYDGEPVYADYYDDRHCPTFDELDLKTEFFPHQNKCSYIGGWDCGQTLNPAFVLYRITPGRQVQGLIEVVPPAPESMQAFAPRVIQAISRILPGDWDEVYHVADQTVIQRSGVDGRNAAQEARRHGLILHPATNQWAPRLSAVTWALTDMIDDVTPRYLISGAGMPILRAGFQGAYKYEDSPAGDAMGPGRIVKMPLKNSYSHVHDANQYALMEIRRKFKI
jgi:hypothetical protein